MKNWLKTYRWHIISWAVFILYEYIFVALILKARAPLLSNIIHYSINIFLFYIHCELVMTKSLQFKQWQNIIPLLVFGILVELTLYTLLSYIFDQISQPNAATRYRVSTSIDLKFVYSTLWRGIYFLLFATAYYFLERYMVQKAHTAELEKAAITKALKEKQVVAELAAAKNAYLKAQINPHFLFNTLTYIYNSTHKSEPRAAEAVRYLSKLMRYALECEHGPEIMPLEGEILQVENLLQLSRIKQPNLYIDFNYDEGIAKTAIIPLVLLSLTENMVKHGNLSQSEDPGKIELMRNNKLLEIKTVNLINTGLNDSGFHTGLDNIKERLWHTYGDSASIGHEKRDGYFNVSVQIPINQK